MPVVIARFLLPLSWAVLAFATLSLTGTPSRAEPRIALVIGNGAYQSVSPLDNPANDARMMADALTPLGFQVTVLIDADLPAFRAAIAGFGRQLRAAGPEATGLFYYAGHGLQSFQTNYLLPVDAELTDAADIDLVGVQADAVLRQMSSARNRTNIVILDACRNNPFEALRAFDSAGLAEMKAPTGTFLSYATEPGMVALDGSGENSPFTAALIRALPSPGLPIEQMFKTVRVAVLEATGGRQTPWDSSSLTADFQFVPSLPVTAEDQLWDGVRASRDPMQIMLYMRAYPDGVHLAEARSLLAELMQFDLAAASPPRAAGPGSAAPPAAALPGPASPEPASPATATPAATGPAAASPDPPPPDSAAGSAAQAVPASPAPAAAPSPAAAPAPPAASGPGPAELAALQTARAAGTVAAWEAFLAGFPDGPLSEFARSELAAARSKEVAAAPASPQSAGEDWLSMDVMFDQPLGPGAGALEGKALSELIRGTPQFPPFEGLPEQAWKGQPCAACHQWTKEALCEQGSFYVKNQVDDGLGPVHPYGGHLRRAMRAWAAKGCH